MGWQLPTQFFENQKYRKPCKPLPFTVCPSRLEMLPTPLSLLHEMEKKLCGCNMKKKCPFKRRKSFSYQKNIFYFDGYKIKRK